MRVKIKEQQIFLDSVISQINYYRVNFFLNQD
jgi:hypothetical protein